MNNIERDSRIYEMFMSGKSYVACGMEFEITDSGVKQALRRHRERNNLPKGRNKEARVFYVGLYRRDCE